VQREKDGRRSRGGGARRYREIEGEVVEKEKEGRKSWKERKFNRNNKKGKDHCRRKNYAWQTWKPKNWRSGQGARKYERRRSEAGIMRKGKMEAKVRRKERKGSTRKVGG